MLERAWASEHAAAVKPAARAFTACSLAHGWAARGDAEVALRWLATAEGFDAGCPAIQPARFAVRWAGKRAPRPPLAWSPGARWKIGALVLLNVVLWSALCGGSR